MGSLIRFGMFKATIMSGSNDDDEALLQDLHYDAFALAP